MDNQLLLYNTLSRTKEVFEPINPPFVGMYVCGPTVYGDPHLGHARPAITFDIVFRYLLHLGYKVRYVRNITDVGHLENDEDEGEDKIAKKARVEQVEPMEVAQYYSDRYFLFMDSLNVKRPSIEPRASGHIIEQIVMIQHILDEGYGYIVNGSVYFDVTKYNDDFKYGRLSGRILEDLISNTRVLEGQDEKRRSVDFALWKKARPEHIMRWPSPWSDGFPGWHLECSAMSTKYLSEQFDIHGGGLDLLFPHHESEIAQSRIANGKDSVKYWMHNNLITIEGQKMGKSLGNFITLEEFFTGNHKALSQAYSPMTIRFFILQAHYRSTLDFSDGALQAADKGLKKLLSAYRTLTSLVPGPGSRVPGPVITAENRISSLVQNCFDAMNDDFNSPIVIANLFETVRIINSSRDKKEPLSSEDILGLKELFKTFFFEILGMKEESKETGHQLVNGLMETILTLRRRARENKDWGASDQIRAELEKLHIIVKDTKEGPVWSIEP
ncbi:MAG: cysteine--tRNA ligase [Bacteroidetes bacterium]|nr:cysteine--tRNA ligase [Bacteroidota bacterium]